VSDHNFLTPNDESLADDLNTKAALRGLPARASCRISPTPFLQVARPWCSAGGDVQSGSVKWFDVKKGFGFIQPKDGGPDVFVHQTAIHAPGFRSLLDGEEVEFKVQDDGGRKRAQDVTGPDGHFVIGRPAPTSEHEHYND